MEAKVHVGIRDNAANMVSAMRIAQINDFGCMAHTLQLVLNDALFLQTSEGRDRALYASLLKKLTNHSIPHWG